VFAETQTSGLGTNSRNWSSPPGGIYLSFGFRVTNPPKNFHTAIPLFNIFSSLVLRELITEKAGKSGVGVSGQNGGIKFKWPNDVFWGKTRKLAGIKSLVQSDGSGLFCLLGVGINFDNRLDSIGVAACRVRDLGSGGGVCFGTRGSFELEYLERLYLELNGVLGARARNL
jgi:BirA family biotin operon repressor/biotin-[acetyl-CoA-carboxylase] ligase